MKIGDLDDDDDVATAFYPTPDESDIDEEEGIYSIILIIKLTFIKIWTHRLSISTKLGETWTMSYFQR